ncbi:MAG: hypothetical protein AUK33_09020 [Flavobacteriaceae bacterium CG2_30_34_30]
MKKINKILLLTDFSEVSENATSYAMLIAAKTKANVHILHVLNTPVDWVKISLENEKLYPETKAEIGMAKFNLTELTRKFNSQGIEAQQSLVFNLGVENIAGHIKNKEFDLLIMGSHGTKGIKEVTIGSNAQKIVRRVPIPTLVVKNKHRSNTIKNIVFASTFEEDQKNAFKQIAAFSEQIDATLHLLFINTPYHFVENFEIEERLKSFCNICLKPCIKHVYNALNEERGVKYFIKNNEIDLFSIATTAKSGFVQLFTPSLTESLINHLDIPVLSIHRNEA